MLLPYAVFKEVVMDFPKMYRIRQSFDRTRVKDIPATVKAELGKLNLGQKVKPGQTVALTAGSRGVANIALILKAAVEYFKSHGGKALYFSGHGQPRGRQGRRADRPARPLQRDRSLHRRARCFLHGGGGDQQDRRRGPGLSSTRMPPRPTGSSWWAGSSRTRNSRPPSKAGS